MTGLMVGLLSGLSVLFTSVLKVRVHLCSASTATTFVSHGPLIIIQKVSILLQALNHWKAIVFFSSAFQDFSLT